MLLGTIHLRLLLLLLLLVLLRACPLSRLLQDCHFFEEGGSCGDPPMVGQPGRGPSEVGAERLLEQVKGGVWQPR